MERPRWGLDVPRPSVARIVAPTGVGTQQKTIHANCDSSSLDHDSVWEGISMPVKAASACDMRGIAASSRRG
jgi:hypothetical protein